MSKLPKIFHNNNKIISKNRSSFNTFNNKETTNKQEEKYSFDKYELINYFNKKINIYLKDGSVKSGILISKRNNIILLDNLEKINIKDIININ